MAAPQPVSDPVALKIAGDPEALRTRGAVAIRGFVVCAKKDTAGQWVDDPSATTFRVYTSDSFDRWLEIATADLIHQDPPSLARGIRSTVWVKPNATITKSEFVSGLFAAQLADTGSDDPTAYPRGGGG